MCRSLLAAMALLSVVCPSFAAVEVVLTLDRPQPIVENGIPVNVAVGVRQEPGNPDRFLRLAGLDFSASDPELTLNGFAFELTGLVGDANAAFHDLPLPQTVYPGLNEDAARMLLLPGDGSLLNLGTLNFTLPPIDGVYLLDAVHHHPASPLGAGALFSYGFGVDPDDPIVDLTPGSGITGGVLSIVLVPEPSMVLLAAGGFIALYLRRSRAKAHIHRC